MSRIVYSVLSIMFFLVSCQPANPELESLKIDNPNSLQEKEQNQLIEYCLEMGWDCKKTSDGLFYFIEKEGEGPNPTLQNKVTVHYSGTLLDGTEFDSSKDKNPITFRLGMVIPGWQKGIPLLKKGGQGKLLIPSQLAYKDKPNGEIPANSPLIFDVELIDVK